MKEKKGVGFMLSNRWLYTLISLTIILIISVSVYAFGTSNPSVFGHSVGEIDFSSGITIPGMIKTTAGGYDNNGVIGWNYHTLSSHNNGWLYLGDQNGNVYGGRGIATGNLWVNDRSYLMGDVGIGSSPSGAKLDISGGSGKWVNQGWDKALELSNAAIIKWESNGAGWRHGIGQTSNALYFGRAQCDTPPCDIVYDMYIDSNTGMLNVQNGLQINGGSLITGGELRANSIVIGGRPFDVVYVNEGEDTYGPIIYGGSGGDSCNGDIEGEYTCTEIRHAHNCVDGIQQSTNPRYRYITCEQKAYLIFNSV